jgi:hypothetical protein
VNVDKALASAWVKIARCPTHGLHGRRDFCFDCDKPVEQVAMLPVAELEKLQPTEGDVLVFRGANFSPRQAQGLREWLETNGIKGIVIDAATDLRATLDRLDVERWDHVDPDLYATGAGETLESLRDLIQESLVAIKGQPIAGPHIMAGLLDRLEATIAELTDQRAGAGS